MMIEMCLTPHYDNCDVIQVEMKYLFNIKRISHSN